MREVADREGKLVFGDKTVRLRLARTENPYRPVRRTVWPRRSDIAGGQPEDQAGDVFIRRWSISDWEGGEVGGKWKPGGYRLSSNVRPDRVGDKLILGANRLLTQTAAAADFAEGVKFGRAHGGLWAIDDASAHKWDLTNSYWPTTGWDTGATTQTVTSFCDFGDGLNLLVGYDDKSIRKVATGAQASHFAAAGASFNPELRSFQSVVYYLDGPNLYELSTGATDTRTALATPGDRVTAYMASAGNIYRRMCVTDTGVAWVNPDDDGNITVYEYNAKNQTDFSSGRIPVDAAFPYSVLFAHGFIFVAFRYGAAHTEGGPAYIYYQRGAQTGTTPEIRLSEASTASQPVILAGMIGDDLIFYYSKSLYAYDLSAGAVYHLGASATSGPTTIKDAIAFGKDVFVSNVNGAAKVERFNTLTYSTETASWRSGRFDFDFPGLQKTLYRVTAVTDPLAAGCSLTLSISTDGATAVTVPETYDTDDDTSYTWTVSDSDAQVTGYDFELVLGMASTSSASTPTVRELFTEAGPAQKRRGFELDLDVTSAQTVRGAAGPALLSQLIEAAEYSGGIVRLYDPWGSGDYEAADEYDVMVEVLAGGGDTASVRLWETSLT